ncbi:hypothetical protein [Nocardioides sp.]|uniref:hypothetical protein n=1 Tax=Nocardioides sp. TaxID=35761 RepID=UPI00378500CF
MTRPPRRAVATAAATLALGLLVGGCSGSDSDAGGPSADPSASATEHPVDTQVSWGSVTGKLPPEARARVAQQVTDVVDGWTTAAYLGGDYPRRDFSDAWPGFTPGAQEEAHADRALMSNEDIGARIDGVEPYRSKVRIDVLAVRQRPVGITAHVHLAFGTTGDLERTVRVAGQLFLTPTEHGWKVFAYDVSKGGA